MVTAPRSTASPSLEIAPGEPQRYHFTAFFTSAALLVSSADVSSFSA